jgi:hypothetical protein
MTTTAERASSPAAGDPLEAQLARVRTCEIAVAWLTYNNADTISQVATAAARGLADRFPGASVAFIVSDAGSKDGTPALIGAVGLPTVVTTHEAPPAERVTTPFHGVPGRGAALHGALATAQRLGARVLLLLEPDVVSLEPVWAERLATPVWEEKADLVSPSYARHRFDGTITNLLIAPLVGALYGRRVHQPLGGQQALSGRLVEHLLRHPRGDWGGRELADVWVLGTAIVDGFAVWEAWLGPRVVRSRTRSTDLPTMVAQTLGGVLAVMDHHDDLWREVRGSEPLPAVGEPQVPDIEPRPVNVEQMLGAFRQGLRDLTPVWEHVLAPDTLGDVLSLEASAEETAFTFPDDLWARVVYDAALGHHYAVIHREHLLRSLVPLYLGRTAAYVIATQARSAAASEAATEAVARAFERQKTYLVERWT